MNQEKLGKFIAHKRKEKNMTQKQLALKIGVTDKAVSRWERGIGCPDISYLDDLSKTLNISIVELLKGEEIDNVEIQEQDIIESMKYSKNYTKQQIKNTINTVLYSIVIIISICLIMFNIINRAILKNAFNSNMVTTAEHVNTDFSKYYKIIENNRGRYSAEEYNKIIKYLDVSKKRFNNKTEEFYTKDKYTIKDLYLFDEYYNDELKEVLFNQESLDIYKIIVKYDNSKIDNMAKYYRYSTYVDNSINSLDEFIYNTYDYKNNTKVNHVTNITFILNMEYSKEEIILKDIIEVGDMNE